MVGMDGTNWMKEKKQWNSTVDAVHDGEGTKQRDKRTEWLARALLFDPMLP